MGACELIGNREGHEPSMEARARPRGGNIRDERPREGEPSQPARHIDPILRAEMIRPATAELRARA